MKNQKRKAKKIKPVALARSNAPSAIQMAIDRAEKEFREEGRLPALKVQHNPFSGKSKVTLYDDCEDGMQQNKWEIP